MRHYAHAWGNIQSKNAPYRLYKEVQHRSNCPVPGLLHIQSENTLKIYENGFLFWFIAYQFFYSLL